MKMKLTTISLITALLISSVLSDRQKFRDEAASKVNWSFKPKPRSGQKDVAVILLDWEPSSMVENSVGLQQEDYGVEIKSGGGEFRIIEQQPRLRGGKFSYEINIVPCEDQTIRFFVKNGEDDPTYLNFDDVISASSDQEIAESSYNLSPTQNGRVEKNGDQVSLSWSPSACAASYLVTLKGEQQLVEEEVTDTRMELSLSELSEECGHYDVSVTAVRGEKYSDSEQLDSVSTAPTSSAVEDLEVKVTASQNSVSAIWFGHKSMPCVSKYSAWLCGEEGQCGESTSLHLDPALSYVEFNSEQTLTECTTYTLVIRPEYDGKELQEKRVSFKTKSPKATELNYMLSSVSAVVNSDQGVMVSWTGGKCVSHYQVYQQAVTNLPVPDWELVTNTDTNTVNIPGVPCTEYSYGVKAVIDGEESEIVQAEENVNIPLNPEEPYSVAGLSLVADTSSLQASWDHASCVRSYRLVVCPEAGETEDCATELLTAESGDTQVTAQLENLSPCTHYKLSIFATTDDQEISEPAISTFSTEAPAPLAPENISVVSHSDNLHISFSSVQCATKYKVYEMEGEDQDAASEVIKEIDVTSVSIASPAPCTAYRYAVAAIVEDVEGPKTEFLGEEVPPKTDENFKPSLNFGEEYNNTIEIELVSPDINEKCEVESYLVKYQSSGQQMETVVTSEDLSAGLIVLTDVDTAERIEGKIKYLGYDWSPTTSYQPNKIDVVTGETNGMIVPIVIGVLVAVVILVSVIFFIVRRKKMSQNKYDCDNSDKSETKQLNAEGEP